MKKKFKIINYCAIGLVAATVVTLNVLALDTFEYLIQDRLIGYSTADKETLSNDRENGEALAKEIVKEGTVLLKNENNSLPLSTSTNKINVFGWSATQWIGGGSGSGRVVSSMSDLTVGTTFLDALKEEGIEYNDDLISMYESYCSTRPGFSEGTLNTYDYEFHRIVEPDINKDYSDELLDGAMDFSDTAIVVIGRMSGESSDCPKVQYKGDSSSSKADDETRTYLEISTEEEALLEYVGANYENTIVLINSTNTMELGFLDTIEGLDSCLLVSGTGSNAATGIVDILYGLTSPSGRTVDTYAYDFDTNASYANSGIDGENFYTNGKGLYPYDGTNNGNVGNSSATYPGLAYIDYKEDIYVGYKWYETADVEGYWDNVSNEYGEKYEGVVQYPFGYGLSYTDFSYEIVGLNHSNNSKLEKDDEIEVTVRVTNIGDVEGKEVVELYYCPPYYENQIEKASINLCAFGKTGTLKPQKYEDVTLTFKVEDMASYDCYDYNNNGFKGYELDKGEYEIKLMNNAHEEAKVEVSKDSKVDSSTITYKVESNIQYATDSKTGVEVKNRFTGDDAVDGVSIDGEDSDGDIIYLTRSDFESTFPTLSDARKITSNVSQYNLYSSTLANEWKETQSDEEVTFGASTTYKVYEDGKVTELGLELGANYDDEMWDQVLDQMTLSEAKNLTLHGYCQTTAVSSIGKPKLNDSDGPAQIGSFNSKNVGTGYPNATTLGQSWSTSLSYDMGISLGTEARNLGYNGWYGPGVNMHRSPFGGRNYEYFSEDSLFNGLMAGNAVKGAKNCGVYCYLKHYAIQDQESYRDGLYTWLSEQALRETYLKPFRYIIEECGANGVMTSYNRCGAVWAGGSEALISEVLKGEWGFKGVVLTDYADHHKYMNMDHALRAGGDLFMDGWSNNGAYGQNSVESSSNAFKAALKKASKNIIYSWLNAIYTNSIYNADEDTKPIVIGEKGEPDTTWKIYIYVGDGVIAAGLIAWGVLISLNLKKKKEVKTE